MDASRDKPDASKDMFSTGRRSAISTSELGLYSDYSDHYKTDTYGNTVRKFFIGIMVVVSVILIGIFLYDFASSASISSKVSQETKHIYILQNSLRMGLATTKKPSVTLPPTIYIVNTSNATLLEDRSDGVANVEFKDNPSEKPMSLELESREQRMSADEEPQLRMQNLQNFKIRNNLLSRRRLQQNVDFDNQMIDNHAINYRVSRLKIPGTEEDDEENADNGEETRRAMPFRFELKDPQPASFKRPRYPQLTQYRYPHASRNIQDIIKYLTSDPDSLNRGFKFTGFYVNPKKYYSAHTDIGVVAMNSDKSEEQESAPYTLGVDPLYQYKPKHPTDVNLLATSNLRFSPAGLQRYNPYYDTYYQRPSNTKNTTHQKNQYENAGAHSSMSYGKKRKPKPFSVMLDIYPISEGADQTPKASRLKPQIMMDEPHSRRPYTHPYSSSGSTGSSRHPKVHGVYTPSSHQVSEEDEKHQMILHLNLYPKKKSKHTRNEIIDRTQNVPENEKEQLINRMMIPFDAIAKHLTDHVAVEEAKLHEDDDSHVRYGERILAKEDVGQLKDAVEIQVDGFVGTSVNYVSEDDNITTIMSEDTTNTMATIKDTSRHRRKL